MICPQCGKEFEPTKSAKWKESKGLNPLCSRSCAAKLGKINYQRKTHCKRGHERTPENTYKNGDCIQCCALRKYEWYAKNGRNPRTPTTYCVRGHQRIPENLYGKSCKLCMKLRYKENAEIFKEHRKLRLLIDPEAERKKYEKRKNDPEVKKRNLARAKNNISLISNSYVAHTLGVPVAEIPPEVIEFKRTIIQLKRELKNATANSK